MRKLLVGAFVALLLAACATVPQSPRQALFVIEQTFIRVVNQVAAKCQQRVLTKRTCVAAADVAETTQKALELAWATDTTDYDSIQQGIRQLQVILKGPRT